MLKGGVELAALTVVAIAAAAGVLVYTNPALVGENPWIPVTGEAVAGGPGPSISTGEPVPGPGSLGGTVPLESFLESEPEPAPQPRFPPSDGGSGGGTGGGGGGGDGGDGSPSPNPEPPVVIPEPPAPRTDLPLSPQWDPEVRA